MPEQVTRGALVAHRYTYEPPLSVSRSVSLWNDLADHVFDGVGLGGFDGVVHTNV